MDDDGGSDGIGSGGRDYGSAPAPTLLESNVTEQRWTHLMVEHLMCHTVAHINSPISLAKAKTLNNTVWVEAIFSLFIL